jgi:hypothetical protein
VSRSKKLHSLSNRVMSPDPSGREWPGDRSVRTKEMSAKKSGERATVLLRPGTDHSERGRTPAGIGAPRPSFALARVLIRPPSLDAGRSRVNGDGVVKPPDGPCLRDITKGSAGLRLAAYAETVSVLQAPHRGEIMKRILASAAVGAALLAAASSEASAWVCLAAGAGSSGYGRDPYYVQDAKIIALRTCERRSPIPICTIVWCRPGMR